MDTNESRLLSSTNNSTNNENKSNNDNNANNNDDDVEYFGQFNAIISPTLPFSDSKQLQLRYRANLVGEKIINPGIHLCDECQKPILVYGRMIPCKHVFCYDCVTVDKSPSSVTTCLRCSNNVMKIEKCKIGTVFLCRNDSCRRTYLSQRDLEAHIQHRHTRRTADGLLRF